MAVNQQAISQSESGTGIRTGQQYLDGLRDNREIWTLGKRVADVTAEPGMSRGAATVSYTHLTLPTNREV